MPGAFERKLRAVRLRCSVNVLLEQCGRVLVWAGIVATAAILVERLLAIETINNWTAWCLGGMAAVVTIGLWRLGAPSRMQVALLVDERLKLHERFSTKLAMADLDDAFARAACQEAQDKSALVNPKRHFPVETSQRWVYASGTWLLVVILVIFLPQKDLLGFLKKQEDQQKQALEFQLAITEIKESTDDVKLAIKQLGDPELSSSLEQLDAMPQAAQPQAAKRAVIRKLGDLADKVKKMQTDVQLDSVQLMQEMLKQLRGSPQAFSQQLSRALAKGDFSQAADLMRQFQRQLEKGDMSKEQREALKRQLQDLAAQLEQLAQKNRQLADELEKLGLDKDLAKLSAEQLRKALEKQGLRAEAIEQLLQKMAACRSAASQCSTLSSAMESCGSGAGGLSPDDLASLTGEFDELDSFKQQMVLTQATLDEIERAIACLGEGMCDGPGCQGAFREGLSQGSRPGTGGPGRGYGPRGKDEDGQTSTNKTKAKGQTKDGPVVASWYFKGSQIKGQAHREFSEVVAAGRDSAAEAISDNEIPPKYAESVKNYFGRLEEIGPE